MTCQCAGSTASPEAIHLVQFRRRWSPTGFEWDFEAVGVLESPSSPAVKQELARLGAVGLVPLEDYHHYDRTARFPEMAEHVVDDSLPLVPGSTYVLQYFDGSRLGKV